MDMFLWGHHRVACPNEPSAMYLLSSGFQSSHMFLHPPSPNDPGGVFGVLLPRKIQSAKINEFHEPTAEPQC